MAIEVGSIEEAGSIAFDIGTTEEPRNTPEKEEGLSVSSQSIASFNARQERLRTETPSNVKLQAIPNQLLDILIKYGNNKDGIPPLLYATKLGDLESVKMLINHGADPFTRGSINGRTALYYALHSRNLDMVEFLLEKGLDPNIDRYAGGTGCWQEAVKYNDIKLFDLLIKWGLKLKPSDYHMIWDNPVFVCLAYGSLKLLKHLLLKGAELPSAQDRIINQIDPILYSVSTRWDGQSKDKIECLHWLIKIGRLNLNNFENFDISNSYPEFVLYLIDHNHVKLDYNFLSRVSSRKDLLLLAIDKGIDLNVKGPKNSYGRTVLHNMASVHGPTLGFLEAFKIILDNGADVNSKDDFGKTPLEIAQEFKVQKLLIEYGAMR